MNKLDFDSHRMEIPCGACGEKISRTIGELKANQKLTCPKCGTVTNVDISDLKRGLAETQKSVDDLRRQLREMGKKLLG